MVKNNEDTSKIVMDTHTHSYFSDGVWSPRGLVREAKLRGLKVIALTDHDTMLGVPEAIRAGKEFGVKVIPGIEIGADYRKGNVFVCGMELVGLNMDIEKIKPFTDMIAGLRTDQVQKYVDNFGEYIRHPDFEEQNWKKRYPLASAEPLDAGRIIAWKSKIKGCENPAPFVLSWDMIDYLLENRMGRNAAVKKALAASDSGDREEIKKEYLFIFEGSDITPPHAYDVISAVKKAGGKSFIAHPGLSSYYREGMEKEWRRPESEWLSDETKEFTPYKLVKDLKKHGLDGVELSNYAGKGDQHGPEEETINKYFSKLSEKLGLIVTYGSDCHGPRKKGPMIGIFGSKKIIDL